jgi:hypothetical protein
MGQQLFEKVSTESLKLLDGFSQVDRVPEQNRGTSDIGVGAYRNYTMMAYPT